MSCCIYCLYYYDIRCGKEILKNELLFDNWVSGMILCPCQHKIGGISRVRDCGFTDSKWIPSGYQVDLQTAH